MDYLGLAVSSVVALASAGASFARLRRARIIEDTPTSKIRSAHQGYVELIGIAKEDGGLPVLSPLSQTHCLWYRFQVEEYRSTGKNSRWHVIRRGSSDAPFMIDDGSGLCFLFPEGAEVRSHRRRQWRGSSRLPQAGGDRDSGVFSLGGRYRFTEYLLQDGDPIYALGEFSSHHPPNPEILASEAQGRILSEWKQDMRALLSRFDRDGNGELDLREWELAREEALRKARREVEQHPPLAVTHTLAKTSDSRRPYLIASSDPKVLSRRFRWQAIGLCLVSLAAVAASVWQISQNTGP